MAGGKGTRISALFPDVPKPLIPITNTDGVEKPVLEWEIISLVSQGFTDIILTVSHMADKIETYFGTGEQLGAHIQYFCEETPLGNAGALFKMRDRLGDAPFLLLNADAVFDIDFNRFVQWHRSHSGALVSLFTHPNSHPYDSGLIISDESRAVLHWLTKEDARPEWYKNRVNAGLHVIDPIVLDMTLQRTGLNPESIGTEDKDGKSIKVDLDRQILKPLCGNNTMFAYDSPEYVKDMGTPERYEQVCQDFKNGIVKAKNLTNKQKAIFLDRDGTINKYVGFLREIDQFELLPGAAEAIKRINESGFIAIVITNQPVIARGEVTISQLDQIHMKLETLLGKQGAYLDGLYYCPHHPDRGFEGEVVELKINCDCRKPKPGLIHRAVADFNISLEDSWMIGDGKNDVDCGRNAGCKTALIGTEDYGQDVTAGSLLTAVEAILGK